MFKKLNLFEKSLLLCMIIIPYTLLRFGIMGVGEVLIIILFLSEFNKRKLNFNINDFIFTKFWILYLIISLFGFSFNVLFLNHKTGTFEGMLFDFSAYFLILLASYTFESFYFRKGINIYLILKYLFFSSGIILSILYTISFVSPSIAGLPLRYHVFFAPLVNNLHQISMYIIPFPFIGVLIFEKERKVYLRVLIIILIILFFKMGIDTGSFKAFMGLYIAGVIYFYLKIISKVKGEIKNIIIIFSVIGSVLFTLLYFDSLSELVLNIFKEEDVSDGRANLYSNAFKVGLSSPIVGLGTGPHILNNGHFWDAHQTLLAVFLQTGLVGLFLFVKLLVKISIKFFKTPALFTAMIPLLVYILGGDVLRRLPVWLFFLLFYYYTPEQQNLKNE